MWKRSRLADRRPGRRPAAGTARRSCCHASALASRVALLATLLAAPATPLLAAPLPGPPGTTAAATQEFGVLMQQGLEALQAGRAEDAAAAFRAALRLQPDSPVAQTLLGNALLEQGDPAGALEVLTSAVQTAPDYYPARNLMARAHVAAGRTEAAIPHLEAAVRLQPEDSASRALLANLLLQAERLDAAAEHAADLAERHPDQAAVHALLGTVHLQSRRFDEALDAYDRALALAPENALARYGRAAALAGLERGAEAVPILARLVDEDDTNVDALVLLGDLLAAQGVEERLDAIRFYRQALQLRPDSRRVVRPLASLYLDLGLDVQGIELLRASGDPQDPALQMALGRMLERESRYEDAREAYRLALDAGAGAEAHYRLGVTLANLADLPGAASQFRLALELDRRHPTASRELGSVLLDQGDAEAARLTLERAVARNPQDSESWYLAGVAQLRTGETEAALDYLRTALEMDPDNTEALSALGTALRQQGQIEESREALARLQELRRAQQGTDATEVRGRRAEGIVRDAYVRYRIGEYEVAREMFEQVLDLAPAEERAWYYLGLTRAALGDDAGAIESLERASELNPERVGSWLSLAQLYERTGRAEDARKALQRAEAIGRAQQA